MIRLNKEDSKLKRLTKLFLIFFKIGLISFGGGYGMIIVMKKELVERGLTSEEDFMDSLIIAQSVPGALAVNLSIAEARAIEGSLGAIVAFIGVVLPSFFCILFLSELFNQYKDNVFVNKFMEGTKPAVVALVFMSFWNLFKSAKHGVIEIILIALTAFLTIFVKLHPILILVLVGCLAYILLEKRKI